MSLSLVNKQQNEVYDDASASSVHFTEVETFLFVHYLTHNLYRLPFYLKGTQGKARKSNTVIKKEEGPWLSGQMSSAEGHRSRPFT